MFAIVLVAFGGGPAHTLLVPLVALRVGIGNRMREKIGDSKNENGEEAEEGKEVKRNTIKLNDIVTMDVIIILYGISAER